MTAPILDEIPLMNMFIQAVPFALRGIHVERRNIINEKSARGHWLKNGQKGQADVFVVYRGVHVELETKAHTGTLREHQERWQARCLNPPHGWPPIPYLILRARRDESPSDTVTRWISELTEALQHV